MINDIIDYPSTIERLTIKYYDPVDLSNGNITIFQSNGSSRGIIRQIVSLNSRRHEDYIEVVDDTTVSVKIISSTFNMPNETYYVLIDNNFVKNRMYKDPLYGLNEKVWLFKTSKCFINFLSF